MKFKAIIFDLDGTIIDTDIIWDQATNHIITSRGITLTPELKKDLYKKIKGLALQGSCSIIKDMFELHNHNVCDLVEEKKQKAQELYQKHVTFIEGFHDFHKKVVAENLLIAIATNSDDHNLETAIKKLNLRKYFGDHIYSISHVNYVYKPAPDVYLHAAKQLGIEPLKCVAIEDSIHGVNAAKNADMFCIGINTGGSKEDLQKANFIIDRYDQIELDRLLKKNKQ